MSTQGETRNDPAESSADLVARIRRADPQAEDQLVERYRRGISIILRAECSDAAAVDDLFQDTFRIALEKIRKGDLREPKKLSGFICAVARNLVVEHFRRVARRGGPRAASTGGTSRARGRIPSKMSSARSAQRWCSACCPRCPRIVTARFWLRFYVAEDEKDSICRHLGLTSLHFNRVLFRARERYRALYLEMAKKRKSSGRQDNRRPRNTLDEMDHTHTDEHQLADRYLMGRLDDAERRRFEEHFVDCPACLERLETIEGLRGG